MPDRTISVLSIACGVLVTAYIALVVVTISYAAWQTDLAASTRTTESQIATTEDDYYATMARLAAIDPTSQGLVLPRAAQVHYAVAAEAPTLTLR